MPIQVKNAKKITLGSVEVKQIKDSNGNVLWKKATVVEWWLDQAFLSSLTVSDVGLIKEVLINGQIHQVRLIGIDHDDLADGTGKAHTTWEFVNLISDASGHSLATVWNDTATISGSNYDYTNSSIRKALNGTGNAQQFKWCERQATAFSTTYTGTVLSMLPESLRNAIKTVKKKVNTNSGSGWTLTEYTDKLFLLTTKEMGYSSQYSEDVPTYDYYEGHTSQTDAIRIKKQVKSEDILTSYTQIPSGSGQSYTGSVSNRAGHQSSTEGYGGYFWLRSPDLDYDYIAWYVNCGGYCGDYYVYDVAFGVAPAFCL